jgi:hypothetical protein
MIPVSREALKPFAGKYVWWKMPDEAVTMPERVIAQVMNIGDYSDVQSFVAQVGAKRYARSWRTRKPVSSMNVLGRTGTTVSDCVTLNTLWPCRCEDSRES